MASVSFEIDFGEPSGSLEEMGCEDFKNAQEVIDALQEHDSVARALRDWSMLDFGSVRVTYTPDIPADLQMKSADDFDPVKHASLSTWLKANQTVAEWSDRSTVPY